MQAVLIGILSLHAAWIAFVLFGARVTRGRRYLTAVHLLALVWGIVVEVGPWPCPLTVLELRWDAHMGIPAYGGGCVAHALGALIYPNLPDWLISVCGVGLCFMNLGIYVHRFWTGQHPRPKRLP